jgi:peptide/nickel transport system permease protein
LRLVLFKHALRNAVLPVVSLAAVQLGNLLEGSIVIETIFALEGIGMLAWQSIQRLDFLVLQGIVLIVAGVYVLLTIGADILNARLDPRLRLGSVLK